MPVANRINRKASNADIIRLNSLGYSLATIAAELDCHPTSVTQRLKSLNIAPADTRRTFMEDVLKGLSSNQLDWLVTKLGPNISIKDFVRNLILKEFIADNSD